MDWLRLYRAEILSNCEHNPEIHKGKLVPSRANFQFCLLKGQTTLARISLKPLLFVELCSEKYQGRIYVRLSLVSVLQARVQTYGKRTDKNASEVVYYVVLLSSILSVQTPCMSQT